jgi:pescadillo protein
VYKKVTHVVMDRPLGPGQQTKPENKSKEFIQPQYLVDSLNNLILLPTRPYKPGLAAPPHLSPFGVESDGTQRGYMPDRQREINTLAGLSVTQAEEESSSEEEAEVEKVAVVAKKAPK